MLSTLRHKGFSRKVLWGVAVIVILSFGVFGTANQMDNVVNSAGKIYGQNVSLQNYKRAYLDSRDQAILLYGDRFFKLGDKINLEKETWDRLILLREVKNQRIVASDKEVVEFIAAIPFFQRDGKFDQSLYESIVRNSGVFDRKPKDFEQGVRNQIAIKKLLDTSAGPTVITDEELTKEYIKRNEKIKLSYALFSSDDFKANLTASDEETLAFYNEHKENFRQAPMINVQYVHLLYPDKATDTQKEAVKKEALAIAHDLTPKADFTTVAQKHHQQTKDSGYFTQEQPLLTFAWSPEFVDKLFAMKTGESSNPMETPDGWQIARIKEHKEASIPEFNAIKPAVQESAIANKAFNAAKAKAQETLTALKEQIKTKDFKASAESLKLKIEETVAFSRGEYINAPGLVAEFQEESLNLNESNKLSDIVLTSQGPAILYLSATEPMDEKKFTEEKEDFKQMMEAQRRNQAISIFVNKLKLAANMQSTLEGKVRYK